MSNSKFIMAQKLQNVQVSLMAEEITEFGLSDLLQLIYQKCYEENLTFWFNFLEDSCVLNLRDVEHENTELNIRYAYPSIPLDMEHINYFKEMILRNAFLLTSNSVTISMPNDKAVAEEEPEKITMTDDVPPASIRAVMDMLEKNGEPINKKSIQQYLQLGRMSTENRRKCIAYLKNMEE